MASKIGSLGRAKVDAILLTFLVVYLPKRRGERFGEEQRRGTIAGVYIEAAADTIEQGAK